MITLKLTEGEADLINTLIDENVRDGWYYGDFKNWVKKIVSIQLKIDKALCKE